MTTRDEMIEACDRRATTISFRSVFAPLDPKQESILVEEALKFQSAASQLRSDGAMRERLEALMKRWRAEADNETIDPEAASAYCALEAAADELEAALTDSTDKKEAS